MNNKFDKFKNSLPHRESDEPHGEMTMSIAITYITPKKLKCFVCDSNNIKEVRGDWHWENGQVIPNAWYYRCEECGEIFTNMAMSIHNDKMYEKTFNVKLKESEE